MVKNFIGPLSSDTLTKERSNKMTQMETSNLRILLDLYV